MAWWMAAPAVAQLGLSVFGALESRRLARREAEMRRMETDEQVRRFRSEAATRISTARARGAASGIEADSESLTTYVGTMALAFDEQARWMKRAGYMGANITSQAADSRFATDIGGALLQFGAANNWWRKSPAAAAGAGGGVK